MKVEDRLSYQVFPIRLLALGRDYRRKMDCIISYIVFQSGMRKLKAMGGVDGPGVDATVGQRGFNEEMLQSQPVEDCYAFVLGSDSVPGRKFCSISDAIYWWNKGQSYLSAFEKQAYGRVHPELFTRACTSAKAFQWMAGVAAVESIIGKNALYQVHRKHLRARILG